jgi:hypothetical protein
MDRRARVNARSRARKRQSSMPARKSCMKDDCQQVRVIVIVLIYEKPTIKKIDARLMSSVKTKME